VADQVLFDHNVPVLPADAVPVREVDELAVASEEAVAAAVDDWERRAERRRKDENRSTSTGSSRSIERGGRYRRPKSSPAGPTADPFHRDPLAIRPHASRSHMSDNRTVGSMDAYERITRNAAEVVTEEEIEAMADDPDGKRAYVGYEPRASSTSGTCSPRTSSSTSKRPGSR